MNQVGNVGQELWEAVNIGYIKNKVVSLQRTADIVCDLFN